ncbi:MAG TPA: hypothetical protein VM183_01140 [Burkholderiales bacterium]|nr:hypothetical protein [Burkholderiales bacterium]
MRRQQLLAYSLVLGMTACGGGGGGGGSSGGSGSGSTRSAIPPQTALTYTGSVLPATISATSASTITSTVVGANAAGLGSGLLGGVAVQVESTSEAQPTGATGLGRRLAKAMRGDDLGRASNGSAIAGVAINKSIPCDSGSVSIVGSTNDATGAGTAAVDYIDCRTGVDTLNGPASLTIASYDAANGIVTDGTLNFTRVRFTGPGVNFDFSGTLRTQVSVSGARETLTQNIVTQDNATGRQTRTTGLTFVNDYSTVTSPTFFTQSINGNVCDGTTGCVTISTSTAPNTSPWGPLYYSTTAQSFPDWGIINLTSGTGTIRISSLGVDLAKIEVDADGNGVFENNARLRWTEFGTALGADLADTDSDGMHNSWETAKGLNPAVADANGDADSDGYTNLTEYLQGSDPSTNGSVPGPVRHVWVTNVSDLAYDTASGQIDVFLNGGSSGVLLNPVTAEVGAPFASTTATPSGPSTRQVVDGAVTYTLAPTASPTIWTLSSSTGRSVAVTNVAGTNPGSLIRYGARGLAFRTVGTASPGYIYLVETRDLIP